MKIDSKVNDSIAMKGMDSNPQTSLQRRHQSDSSVNYELYRLSQDKKL